MKDDQNKKISKKKKGELIPYSNKGGKDLIVISSRVLVEAKRVWSFSSEIIKKIILISGKVACSSPSPKTHKGEFKNDIEGKPLCFYYFECERCKKPFYEYRHEWTDFIALGDQCKVYRACKHCGIQEYGDNHLFSKFSVDSDCRLIGTCEKCGTQREFGKAHRWSVVNWKDSEGKAREKKTCVQCKKEV